MANTPSHTHTRIIHKRQTHHTPQTFRGCEHTHMRVVYVAGRRGTGMSEVTVGAKGTGRRRERERLLPTARAEYTAQAPRTNTERTTNTRNTVGSRVNKISQENSVKIAPKKSMWEITC